MASATGFNMPGGDGRNPAAAASSSSSAQECRLRRRRRLAPPPLAAAAGKVEKRVRRPSPSSSEGSSSESEGCNTDDDEEEEEGKAGAGASASAAEEGPQQQQPAGPPVAFGWVSVAGRSREMEDTVSLRPGFCTSWVDGSPMHFFAVFDGHGGSHVSTLCRDRMHEFLAEELAAEAAAFRERRQQQQQQAAAAEESSTTTSAAAQHQQAINDDDGEQQQEEEEVAWRAALSRSFDRVDALASVACACGRIARPPCRCPLAGNSGIVGSTAVVALLVRGRVVVANCGDSRAVLCRAGNAVPLSDDHKPQRPDELARIEAAGGRVVYINGHRVRGILAMSRAVGDRMLRPEVITEPEITVTRRTAEDECLVLASDGKWDVISNEVACSVARQCLQDGNPAEAAEARCSRAASLLVRLALGRATWDNVSVVVVDLKNCRG